MSLLTRKEHSLWGLIVFAFQQDKESYYEVHRTQEQRFSFSGSLRVFPSLTWCLATVLKLAFTIMIIVWSEGPLTPAGTKVFDGTSNRSPSTCLKTPQSGLLEEAEAVPAESNGPQRKTNPRIRRSLEILCQKQPFFRWDE